MDLLYTKIASAAIGSLVTGFTMTPFDVIKTRLQTQPPAESRIFFTSQQPINKCCQQSHSNCVRRISSVARPLPHGLICVWEESILRSGRVKGFWDAVRHIWKEEGLRGFWKGTGTTLLIGIPSSTCYMLAYDHLLRDALPSVFPLPIFTPLFAGMLSRCLVSSLMSPLELVRTNLQSTPSPGVPRTLPTVLMSIRLLVREQGLPSLWRGLGPTLCRDVPFSGIYWASYESWKLILEKHSKNRIAITFSSGAISGITAALITQPFDVLKTRRQTVVVNTEFTERRAISSIPLLFNIIRTEGIATVFAGLAPRTAKIAPACGIMISCYEGFGRLLTQQL